MFKIGWTFLQTTGIVDYKWGDAGGSVLFVSPHFLRGNIEVVEWSCELSLKTMFGKVRKKQNED